MFNSGGFRPPLEDASPLLRQLLTRLDAAADVYDNDGPAAMRKLTKQIYADFPAASYAMKAVLTGHAHIDLVWLWPERTAEAKAVHSFATANTLMDQYPEFHFGYSQPASYEAVERRSPALMQAVRKQIKRGNWEPTGAMYVESDTQLACGEALVRSVSLGQTGFNGLTGEDSKTLWLPDVFGYSGCIPSILSGMGVPYFFTTKMYWSSGTRFPHSGFRWRGNDGSEVVSFISWHGYNEETRPKELDYAQRNQRQAGVFNETLFCTGYGDGGGGVTAGHCERARRMASLATLPKTEWGRIDGFFEPTRGGQGRASRVARRDVPRIPPRGTDDARPPQERVPGGRARLAGARGGPLRPRQKRARRRGVEARRVRAVPRLPARQQHSGGLRRGRAGTAANRGRRDREGERRNLKPAANRASSTRCRPSAWS